LISPSMLYPLLAMIAAFMGYYFLIVLLYIRCEILEQEVKCMWTYNLELPLGVLEK